MDLEKGEPTKSGAATPVSQAGTIVSIPPKRLSWNWIGRYLREDVSARHADLLLLICALISGLLDGVMFNGALNCPWALRSKVALRSPKLIADVHDSLPDFRVHADR